MVQLKGGSVTKFFQAEASPLVSIVTLALFGAMVAAWAAIGAGA